MSTTKQCPFCAEEVLVQAIKCKHCGSDISHPVHYSSMVLIPAGEFWMGYDGAAGEEDEYPCHKVHLDDYYLDKFPVTVSEYRAFAQATGRQMKDQPAYSRDNHPVVNVTWRDAKAYSEWVGKRLPTEAEWEKAARTGMETSHGVVDSWELEDYAWYDDNSNGQTHPTGEKKPDNYGLHDILGNVFEWVSDWYDKKYYQYSPNRNPQGPASGSDRVFRGASWGSDERQCSFTFDRSRAAPDYSNPHFGFRCAASPKAYELLAKK